INGHRIAVGRDTRPSSILVANMVISKLRSLGCEIYNFGICPTPAIVMMVKKMHLDGGLQITASHNPIQWNGIKFVSKYGRFFFVNEFNQFKNTNFTKKYYDKSADSRLFNINIINQYLENIISSEFFTGIKSKRFKVGIDSCNGAAEESAVKLIEMFGGIPYSICKELNGFSRAPEPRAENLKGLCWVIKREKLDFGIAFDPDGDRFACVDEKGVPLSEESSVLLALIFILAQKKGAVVVNNSTTMAVDEICRRFNVPVYRSATGEVNVVKKMQEVKAIVGGEGNGGVIVPSINLTRDGLVATAILIKLLAQKNCPLSVIRKDLPQYFMEKITIRNYHKNWAEIILKKFQDDKTIKFDRLDGLKIIHPKFWVLVRKSNTEPILRIIAESKNISLTKSLINYIIDDIKIKK
ncbi:MAG: hypothetical protein N2748_04480, partial [candidate division WOR-3 bacterium]|nr:hypothetical protein [candidate division WOR-3 bacterium]